MQAISLATCLLGMLGLLADTTLQKMHGTAWKLVNGFVSEVVPTWDVSPAKTAQGQGKPKSYVLENIC